MVYCSKCGAEIDDEDKFCKKCGTENLIRPEAEKREKINPFIGYPEKETKETEKEKWPKKLALWLVVWGVLNLFFYELYIPPLQPGKMDKSITGRCIPKLLWHIMTYLLHCKHQKWSPFLPQTC